MAGALVNVFFYYSMAWAVAVFFYIILWPEPRLVFFILFYGLSLCCWFCFFIILWPEPWLLVLFFICYSMAWALAVVGFFYIILWPEPWLLGFFYVIPWLEPWLFFFYIILWPEPWLFFYVIPWLEPRLLVFLCYSMAWALAVVFFMLFYGLSLGCCWFGYFTADTVVRYLTFHSRQHTVICEWSGTWRIIRRQIASVWRGRGTRIQIAVSSQNTLNYFCVNHGDPRVFVNLKSS